MRLLLSGIAIYLASAVFGDPGLFPSTGDLRAENDRVVVVHHHDVTHTTVMTNPDSWLEVRQKSDGARISRHRTMPMTAMVYAGHGYFVAMSQLRGLARLYNFALIHEDGRIVATALVTRTSGHCQKIVYRSVSNNITWFDENDPTVRLTMVGDEVETVLVDNHVVPGSFYTESEAAQGDPCVFQIGPKELPQALADRVRSIYEALKDVLPESDATSESVVEDFRRQEHAQARIEAWEELVYRFKEQLAHSPHASEDERRKALADVFNNTSDKPTLFWVL